MIDLSTVSRIRVNWWNPRLDSSSRRCIDDSQKCFGALSIRQPYGEKQPVGPPSSHHRLSKPSRQELAISGLWWRWCVAIFRVRRSKLSCVNLCCEWRESWALWRPFPWQPPYQCNPLPSASLTFWNNSLLNLSKSQGETLNHLHLPPLPLPILLATLLLHHSYHLLISHLPLPLPHLLPHHYSPNIHPLLPYDLLILMRSPPLWNMFASHCLGQCISD